MLQLTPQSRVFLAREPVDFRRGIDGLCALCRKHLAGDPFDGAIFVFRNRRRTGLKLLCYDGQGLWLCHKRLSAGRLCWWPAGAEASVRLAPRQLQILLWNGNPESVELPEDWRRVA
jgi:transposase